jgi:transposase InsO family protein
MFGHPLIDDATVDPDTGEVIPVAMIVADNGPFRSLNFELFITRHLELRHVRTRVKSPGQNGSRQSGFGTLKYERLFLEEIDDALTLIESAEDCWIEYNSVHHHEAIAWNRPVEVDLGLADPAIPNFDREEILPTT